jgi:hypothetical protein
MARVAIRLKLRTGGPHRVCVDRNQAREGVPMSTIVGSGEFTYRVEEGWGKLPDGWSLGDVGGICIDRQDRVYVFNRGGHPMVIFDSQGNFLKSWGEGMFQRPHSISMAPDDTIYCVDEGNHCVYKCTLDGEVLFTLGTPGEAAPEFSGKPFNRPTQVALSPEGDIYVADGYGNARVHKFSADGKHILSWGEYGTDPGQFNIVHNICCDSAGRVYVADRENHRIQVFDGDGRFIEQWNNLHRACGLTMVNPDDPVFFIGELGPFLAIHRRYPNLGPRVSIVDRHGRLQARLGGPHAGTEPGTFIAPHTGAVDSHGDLYIGEVSHSAWETVFQTPKPAFVRSLQKFSKVQA